MEFGTFGVSPQLVIKNQCGAIATKEELAQLNSGVLAKDHYQNGAGEIVEFVLRPRNLYDHLLESLEAESFKELPGFESIPIDCSNAEDLLIQLYYSDQAKRNSNIAFEYWPAFEDEAILRSYFEQCGFFTGITSDTAKQEPFWSSSSLPMF